MCILFWCLQIRSISAIGGSNVKETTRRLLRHTLTNNCAKQINWKGKNGKGAFSAMHMKSVIIREFCCQLFCCCNYIFFIMRPSSLGGSRILRRTLSVRLSVCLSVRPVIISVTSRHLANYNETCTFRHAQRAAYRTAISAAQACLDLNGNEITAA